MGAQKNRLVETVLLSTHNICFGWEIRKIFFCYALLTKGMFTTLSEIDPLRLYIYGITSEESAEKLHTMFPKASNIKYVKGKM